MTAIRRLNLLSLSVVLALAATGQAQAQVADTQHVLQQSERIPEEFRAHLFGVPLAVRVELDQSLLGDAQVILFEDNRLQLLAFEDSRDSTLPATARQHWQDALAEPVRLGRCENTCADGLLGLYFSLENSKLSITTSAAHDSASVRHLMLPQGGSKGLMVNSSLAVSGGQQQAKAFSYNAEVRGSIGHWSTTGSYQYVQSDTAGDLNGHLLESLFAQRERGDHFARVGLFRPAHDVGARQLSAFAAANAPLLGIMLGTSDALLNDNGSPSLYPVYVTAAGDSSVEIHRDGKLLTTQQVAAGIQQIDTRRLPGGIYDIELRIIENGTLRSVETAVIHKPNQWRDPSRRWRYGVYAGRQQDAYGAAERVAGNLTAGAALNYLLHPRAVVGASIEQAGDKQTGALSMDWTASDHFTLYSGAYVGSESGRGLQAQAMYRYASGSVLMGHDRRITPAVADIGAAERGPRSEARSTLTWNQRLGTSDSVWVRVSNAHGVSAGLGVDAGYARSQPLFGQPANWRLSAYDRPAAGHLPGRRDQGIDFTLNLSMGRDDRRYSGSLGSRSRQDGGRDGYVRASVEQSLDGRWLDRAAASTSLDRQGLGLEGGVGFSHPWLLGNAHLQRGSGEGHLGGSLNLASTVALGGGRFAVLQPDQPQVLNAVSGIIVDLHSDLPDVSLRAYDLHGTNLLLKPGRNFVPVSAYRDGRLQLEFDGPSAPAAAIQPASLGYHLNKGGVMHATVEVRRTVTVMGQVVDADGQGLRGVHVRNAAGRGVSQDGGYFALDINVADARLELQNPNQTSCTISLDPDRQPRQGDVLMVGAVSCAAALAVH